MANSPLLRSYWERIPPTFRNKYFLVLAFFFVWMLFLDKHDLFTQIRLQRTVNKLEQEKEFYQDKIAEEEQRRLDLETNSEKFARERYFMKKDNEDVYILVKE